ncbi:MAG: ComEC/Rec2 family competence protein [Kiritimatiellae bacterium]|nr:ComEC/Rec2 family competence protein [Kiritimatiellia bacterium]
MGVALCFVLASALGVVWRVPPGAILLVTGVLLAAAGVAMAVDSAARAGTGSRSNSVCGSGGFGHWRRVTALVCLYGAVAGMGCANARLSVWRGAHGAEDALLGAGTRLECVGRVVGEPDETASGAGAWRFPLRLEAARAAGTTGWQGAAGRLTVRWRGRPCDPTPRYGQRWLLRGRVTAWGGPAPGARPPAGLRGPPERGDYLLADGPGAVLLEEGRGSRVVAGCFAARRYAAARLADGIEPFRTHVALLHALLLGYRHRLPAAVREDFIATGTLHIFAISGLHVGIIVLLITFVLNAGKIPRVYWGLFLFPLVVGYTLATGARPSAVRACVMALVYFAAVLLDRKPDMPAALALSAVLILAVAPAQVFDVGFIFSFVVVAGLVCLYPRIERPLRRLWQADPLRVEPEKKRVRLLRRAGRYVASLFAVSCSAWLVSAPLTAYFFGRLSLSAPVGNLVVVPLAFLVVLGGCLSLVFGALVPILGQLFNHANVVLISLLLRIMAALARVPCGSVEIERFPFAGVLLWYVALGAVVCGTRNRK